MDDQPSPDKMPLILPEEQAKIKAEREQRLETHLRKEMLQLAAGTFGNHKDPSFIVGAAETFYKFVKNT